MSTDHVPDAGGDGTQAIRRAAAILRRIGRGGGEGVGLGEIARAAGLARSTAHRIVKCLVEEGLVHHDVEGRRYAIGRFAHELGLAVTADTLGIARWRVAVDAVARRTGATTYLISRTGIEATCVLKTDGTSVIRVIPVEVGQRRYLGVGAGSTALLAALDPEACERVIQTVVPLLRDMPHLNADVMRRLVAETRRTGFTVSRGNVAKDVIGVARAIPNGAATPSLALSIAALAAPTTDATLEDWKAIIREEIEAVAAGDDAIRPRGEPPARAVVLV